MFLVGCERVRVPRRASHGDGGPVGHVPHDSARQRRHSRLAGRGFTTLVSQSFALGIRAAAPAVTALLLATLILGLDRPDAAATEHPDPGLRPERPVGLRRAGHDASARPPGRFKTKSSPRMETILEALKTPLANRVAFVRAYARLRRRKNPGTDPAPPPTGPARGPRGQEPRPRLGRHAAGRRWACS